MSPVALVLAHPPAPAPPRRRRPHPSCCRHCAMVEWYRLERAHQEQLAENELRQDEDFRPVTFRQWLESFQWEERNQPR